MQSGRGLAAVAVVDAAVSVDGSVILYGVCHMMEMELVHVSGAGTTLALAIFSCFLSQLYVQYSVCMESDALYGARTECGVGTGIVLLQDILE